MVGCWIVELWKDVGLKVLLMGENIEELEISVDFFLILWRVGVLNEF